MTWRSVTDNGQAPVGAQTVAGVLVRLRHLVLTRELQPGEQIRQEEMARYLGISRVPLREALRVLTTEGLLTHRPHQGYFVTKMSKEDFAQILGLLEFLEAELLRTARWPTDEEVGELRAINQELARAARDHDLPAVNRSNGDLHRQIFRLSPRTLFQAEWERFWFLSEPYRFLHVATTDAGVALAQHDQLIDALAARDRALALRIMAAHRGDTQAAALGALAATDQPVGRLATS